MPSDCSGQGQGSTNKLLVVKKLFKIMNSKFKMKNWVDRFCDFFGTGELF